jgi:hypothetical protein
LKDGNQLGSYNPRRTNGEEDCEEGHQEGGQEALSASHHDGGGDTPVFFARTSRQTGVFTDTKHAEGGDYDGEEDRKESDEEGREEALGLVES